MRDYFTRAEFRSFAGDPGGASPVYSDAEIDDAQAEVIDHLEQWAMSAWPNVTGADGDGTAATRRSTSEVFDPDKVFLLGRLPAGEVTEITVDGEVVADDTYFAYLDEGYVSVNNGLGSSPRDVVITYTYGFESTPFSIKRAAMQATKSLLDQSRSQGKKIPSNVQQYQTEGTTFVFDENRDDFLRPWPWDPDASQLVRSYWSSERPMTVGAV